jgi:hypothetical protein
MSVSDETRQEIDGKVDGAAVAGVLDLGNIFKLISDGLDDEALTQQQSVGQPHQLTPHTHYVGAHVFLRTVVMSSKPRSNSLSNSG